MKIQVTQHFIDLAVAMIHDDGRDSCTCDPIALSLMTTTGEICSVGFKFVKVGKKLLKQSKQVHHWKNCFDRAINSEQPMPLPFEFELDELEAA